MHLVSQWSEGDDILSSLMIKPFRHLLSINLSPPLIPHLPLYLHSYQSFFYFIFFYCLLLSMFWIHCLAQGHFNDRC